METEVAKTKATENKHERDFLLFLPSESVFPVRSDPPPAEAVVKGPSC